MKCNLVVVAGPHLASRVASPEVTDPADDSLIDDAVLRDTLELGACLDFSPIGPPPRLVLAYPDDRSWYEGRVSAGWLLLPQMGTGVTQCLDNLLIMLGGTREDRVVFIGPYTPHLSERVLKQAFTALGQYDVTMGPYSDGGVYLLGVRGRWSTGIFASVRWDTEHAQTDLLQAMRRARLNCALLPTCEPLQHQAQVATFARQLSIYGDQRLSYLRKLIEQMS